jgi:hypothetical protein
MICNRPIYSRFVWCQSCEEVLGARGRQYADWPRRLKELYLDYKREQDQERRLLRRIDELVIALDIVSYGEPNDDTPGPVRGYYSDYDPSGGMLRCLRCGRVFMDIWPTDPFPAASWDIPECPECGASWFVDGDNAGRDGSRTPTFQ